MPTDWPLRTGFDALILPAMKRATTHPHGAGSTSRGGRREAPQERPAVPAAHHQPLPDGEDEAELLACLDGIRSRHQPSLGRLYDLTVSRVYGVALRIARRAELAEEAVQSVYMQVWREIGRYDESRGRVMAWLLIIVRTRSLDLLRRQDEAFSHPDPNELATETDGGDDPQELLAATRGAQRLHSALNSLSPLQRQLLSLAFFKGLTHSEIAAHAGLPLGSVKTHIRRALAELREQLQP